MIPAKRSYFLLISGAIITTIIAVIIGNLSISIVIALIYNIVVLGLTIWDGIGVKSLRVQVTRQDISKLSIGRDNVIHLQVKTVKKSGNYIVEIKDDYPQEFTSSKNKLSLFLSSNKTEEITYTVCPYKRGEYAWGNITIRQLSPIGLAWHEWVINVSQKVSVYPDLLALKSLAIKLSLQSTGTIRQAKNLGMGTEFSELREYSLGDDPRLIDWKATARLNRPLIRVLEPEQEQTLIILLDRGRLMTAKIKGMLRFDFGLNALLSLTLAGINRGDRVGIGVFDRQMTVWIPPQRGQQHLNKIIERLTPIQPEFLEPDYIHAVTTVVQQQSRRALVVIITDIVDAIASAELLGALARLTPRYLPFCVTLRDPQVDVIANSLNTNIIGGYNQAVALDLINQRKLAFANLQQKGVLVLDAPANQISEQLVDRYLQLKMRNRL